MRCHAAGRPGEPPRTFAGGNLTVTLFPDGTFRLREKRDGAAEPLLDLGQWAQEVEGGVRLVLRGSDNSRRAFREIGVGKLLDDNGNELLLAEKPDPIDGRFRLSGLYRDAQDGGLFAPCLVGRTYGVAPGGGEPDLERAWVNMTPSREASLYVEIIGRFDGNNSVSVDRFINVKRDGACPSCRRAARRYATPNGAWSSSTASVPPSRNGAGNPCFASRISANSPPRAAATRWAATTFSILTGCASSPVR